MMKLSEIEKQPLSAKITAEKAEEIIDMYTRGEKFGDIQKAFDISHDDIAVLLSKFGIPRRDKPKKIRTDCMLPDAAFACYRGKCAECGWNGGVHEDRVKRLRYGES